MLFANLKKPSLPWLWMANLERPYGRAQPVQEKATVKTAYLAPSLILTSPNKLLMAPAAALKSHGSVTLQHHLPPAPVQEPAVSLPR
jgi:hypothetical protein